MATVIAPRPFTEDFVISLDTNRALAGHTVRVVADPVRVPELLREAEVLVTGFEKQVHGALEYARMMPRLQWVHVLTAGLGAVASPELVEREVLVTSGAGVFAEAVAEYAFASLVMLSRGLPQILLDGAAHRWGSHKLGWELKGSQAGIIGFGGIGKRLAALLVGIGMTVSAVTRTPERHDPGPLNRLLGPGDLRQVIAGSDAVVLCASANPTTERLLGRGEFGVFKRGSVFVNVSRGSLIDERSLIAALSTGKLSAAMIDVAATEPLGPEDHLWKVPNLWITPHMAGGTREGRARSLERFLMNLASFAAGASDQMVGTVDLSRELGRQ